MLIFTLFINAMYVFIIIQFVQHIVFTNRGMKVQLFASISSSIFLLFLPQHVFFYIANFIVTMLICFPLRHLIQAMFVALCTASLIGGMLFVLSDLWPQSSFVQLMIFLLITFALLLQLIQFIRASSQRGFIVECTVRLFEENYDVKGFIDTGNGCVEPLSQYPVHFIRPDVINQYLYQKVRPLVEQKQLTYSLDSEASAIFKQYGCRFIQLQTVHSSSTTCVAFPGEWGKDGMFSPCFFIFLTEQNRLPQNAQIIFHQSLLHHSLLKEVSN